MWRMLIAVGLLLGACASDGGGASTPDTAPPTTQRDVPGDSTGFVVEVLDGDSLRVDVGVTVEEVRLLGINAPEPGECWADRARDALEASATGVVTLVGEERDQFGRRLAYVYAGANNVNLALVDAGDAIAVDSGHPMAVEFFSAEEGAFDRGAGLWSANACGPPGGAQVTIRDVVFDAPGPDDENPNGEYVVIANDGPSADLTGWAIRDESSVHRFAFPEGFLLETGATVLVRSGCAEDRPGELHWCATGPVWNNDGDMALLLDRFGNVVARRRY